jgi:hypothetical protein
MNRVVFTLSATVLVCTAVAAPIKQVGPFEKGWDKPVDPDGDCKFVRDKGTLTIELPGKHHDLAFERGRVNAPRLLRDVEGDFVAQVRVSGISRPSTDSTSPETRSVVSAGLLALADDRTFISLERGTQWEGEVCTYEFLRQARVERESDRLEVCAYRGTPPDNEGRVYLRMERRGNKVTASVSPDGKKWKEIEALDVKLSAKVKIGVAAVSSSKDPFKPTFDEF